MGDLAPQPAERTEKPFFHQSIFAAIGVNVFKFANRHTAKSHSGTKFPIWRGVALASSSAPIFFLVPKYHRNFLMGYF
jgi:hypothetical protein